MKNLLLWSAFILMLIFEALFTTMPLIFVIVINLIVFQRKEWVFLLAFFAGIVLDLFQMRNFGSISLFLIISLFIVIQYEKKFETASLYFVAAVSFLGSLVFLLIFQRFSIFESIAVTLFSIVIFKLFSHVFKPTSLKYRGI